MPPARRLAHLRGPLHRQSDLPLPSTQRNRNPPSQEQMAEYFAYTIESRNNLDITRHCQSHSPLFDTYLALLQNYHIENATHYIERTNHPLNEHDWVISRLKEIRDEQQELLINILHQLNFEDLAYNINRTRSPHRSGPLDHRNDIPRSVTPSSESDISSSPISQREPIRSRSSSTSMSPIRHPSTPHNTLTTIAETSLPIPPPRRRLSRCNRTQVIFSRPLTHSGSSSHARKWKFS
jgi:hypothetical protein